MIIQRYADNFLKKFAIETPRWEYKNACVLLGAEALYLQSGDSFYYGIVKNYIDACIDDGGRISNYHQQDYNLDNILAGRVLFRLYEKEQDEKYYKAIERLVEQVRNQPRTKSGNFWHKQIYPHQIWLDGSYMCFPFWAQYEKTYGDPAILHDILDQIDNVRTHMFSKEKKLYYHGWEETKTIFWADKKTGCSPNFWLRAIGWYLMALIDVYEILPASMAGRTELTVIWKEALDGLLLYHDKYSGLFYQLVDLRELQGNYLETSGSLMVAYAIFKGVRLGLLDADHYLLSGEHILSRIESRILKDDEPSFSLGGICRGAGLGPKGNLVRDGSTGYYLSEPVVSDEKKGAAACMLAYAEWLRLVASGNTTTGNWSGIHIYEGYE